MAMEQLHPGARWLFRIGAYFGFGFLLVFLSIWLGFAIATIFGPTTILLIVPFFIVAVIVIGEIYARMAYNRWKYEFTPTNLKIERGIIWKKYSNIPYERVQNVDIHRGIIARILGFSTVDIQTAGFHMSYGRHGGMPRSEGHIPAVSIESAEHIREFLMKKISGKHGQGL